MPPGGGEQVLIPRRTSSRIRRRIRRRAEFKSKPQVVREAIRKLSKMVRPAKDAGRHEYAEGLIEALRTIAAITKGN
jgi:Arc/MetJ-type ribon-helix-helix transcriptional regulator